MANKGKIISTFFQHFMWSKKSSKAVVNIQDVLLMHFLVFDREESSLVDIFVIEILATYVESLSLAHNDDQAKGKI